MLLYNLILKTLCFSQNILVLEMSGLYLAVGDQSAEDSCSVAL